MARDQDKGEIAGILGNFPNLAKKEKKIHNFFFAKNYSMQSPRATQGRD